MRTYHNLLNDAVFMPEVSMLQFLNQEVGVFLAPEQRWATAVEILTMI